MQTPLQITVRDLPHSDALDALIRKRVRTLERVHPRLTSCRVAISELSKSRLQGRQVEVRIEIRAPGLSDVIVKQQTGEDVQVALRDAFDAAARRLEDAVRKRRDDEKARR